MAEILPIESADMCYPLPCEDKDKPLLEQGGFGSIPCWSLVALLGVLPLVDFTTPQLIGTPKTLYRCVYNGDLKSHAYENPIDACYEMILKLHELKML